MCRFLPGISCSEAEEERTFWEETLMRRFFFLLDKLSEVFSFAQRTDWRRIERRRVVDQGKIRHGRAVIPRKRYSQLTSGADL